MGVDTLSRPVDRVLWELGLVSTLLDLVSTPLDHFFIFCLRAWSTMSTPVWGHPSLLRRRPPVPATLLISRRPPQAADAWCKIYSLLNGQIIVIYRDLQSPVLASRDLSQRWPLLATQAMARTTSGSASPRYLQRPIFFMLCAHAGSIASYYSLRIAGDH
ncbi:hypothetical protein Taro_046679 [Colocasia esculenta]|uniref:Uncharacterized protein n=1 Tax=Colocasia esculenta TaxID=4460 RepID=A0A843WQM9_COLES|nr:hypothetical protein [Colocasia esculenta]